MQEEKIFTRRHKNRDDLAGEHKWGDMGQLVLLVVFILVIIGDIYFLKISARLHELISLWVKLPLGLFFILFGGILARNGLKIIFGETRREPCVIKKGVFGLVRHPIYLGSILVYLGFLILTYSILGLMVWIIIIFFYHLISCYEEKLLLQKFGDDYKKYMKEVPMWIPKLVKNNK
jgi:protein-S-isoprenylcysteine O-methyltransferase Ste14